MFTPMIPLIGLIFLSFESLILTLSAPILLKPKLLIIGANEKEESAAPIGSNAIYVLNNLNCPTMIYKK